MLKLILPIARRIDNSASMTGIQKEWLAYDIWVIPSSPELLCYEISFLFESFSRDYQRFSASPSAQEKFGFLLAPIFCHCLHQLFYLWSVIVTYICAALGSIYLTWHQLKMIRYWKKTLNGWRHKTVSSMQYLHLLEKQQTIWCPVDFNWA